MEALSQSFSDSISDLAKSNRESAQNIVDQLKSDSDARRSHERKERDMLDNIQRGRKPSI
jgi:mRNA-degrading endonuclease RelE of RelBE toxin-antitoxin system